MSKVSVQVLQKEYVGLEKLTESVSNAALTLDGVKDIDIRDKSKEKGFNILNLYRPRKEKIPDMEWVEYEGFEIFVWGEEDFNSLHEQINFRQNEALKEYGISMSIDSRDADDLLNEFLAALFKIYPDMALYGDVGVKVDTIGNYRLPHQIAGPIEQGIKHWLWTEPSDYDAPA